MEYVKLNELCEINIGKTPSRSNQAYWGNGNKWLSISDMQGKYVSNTKEQITDLAVNECKMKIVPKNTVLMSFKLSIGKIAITTEELYTNEAIASFPIIQKDKLIPEYLYYALQTLKLDKLSDRAVKGATLNKDKLNQIKIPLTTLEQQKKIVKVLNKAQELIDKRKAQIEALDQLTQSVFLEMFGDPVKNNKNWVMQKLSETGELKRGISKYRPRNAPELLNGPYPLIQTGDVANSSIFIKKYNQTYSELGLKQSKMWPKGTLCITIAANIAQTGILTFDACFPDSVVAYIPKNYMSNIYVHFWFTFLQRIIEANAPESAQKNINLKILSELEIPVPPVELQNKFVEIVEKIESQKDLLQKSLEELENNFNSLMQRAFKGELFND